MKNYIIGSLHDKKIVILSDQAKDKISGPNIVVSSLFPFLAKETDIKWKVCSGVSVFNSRIIPKIAKPILSAVLSFGGLLFDKDIKKATIINAHGLSSWLPAIWIAKFFRKISLITFHETYEYTSLPWFFGGGKLAHWVWNYTVKNADYIIDVSGKIKREKSFFIPNGIDLAKFAPKKRTEKRKTVLWVGRFSIEKGIEYFAAASRLIKKEINADFLAITSTVKESPQNKFYTDLLAADKIEIRRQVSRDEMKRIYQEADVLILSSLMEAFPLVLFEAMACGTPVIATDVGGISHAVKNGVVGYLVPLKDSGAIAEKAIKILEDGELRDRMSRNCLEWVKNFSWDKIAEKYMEVYYKIICDREASL